MDGQSSSKSINDVDILHMKTFLKGKNNLEMKQFDDYCLSINKKPDEAVHELVKQGVVSVNSGIISLTESGDTGQTETKKKIKSENAMRLLKSLLQRSKRVNDRKLEYVYVIEKIWLHGNILEVREEYKDIEIVIELAPLYPADAKVQAKEEEDRVTAFAGTFRNMKQQKEWPRLEVIRYLKSSLIYFKMRELENDTHLPENAVEFFPSNHLPANHPFYDNTLKK